MVSSYFPENIICSNALDISTINKLAPGPSLCNTKVLKDHIQQNQNPKRIPPRMAEMKKKIENALQHGKVFMANGSCNTVRRSLLHRGWLEKRMSTDKKTVSNVISYTCLFTKLDNIFAEFNFEERMDQDYYERVQADILSSLLANAVPRFCWNCVPLTKSNVTPEATIINRVGSSFTNKEFISQHLSELSKGNSPMIDIQYPRSYASCYNDQFAEFKDNFRLTASISLLKNFQNRIENQGEKDVFDDHGGLEMTIIESAIKYLMDYLECKKHEDIDKVDSVTSMARIENCDAFLENAFQFVHRGKTFDKKFKLSVYSLLNIIKDLLNIVEKYWPQYHLDGMLNMWLVKPAYGSRGNNIHVLSSFKEIQKLVTKPEQRTRWVIQKYVDYYLRFSSRPFNLSNYHESIHLTNYSVQKKYKNCYFHTDLPDNNMWNSDKFQEYLQDNGYSSICCENVFLKMAKCIIGCILSIESNIKRRENSFHLYGADFILDKMCSPWLIEINSYPDMSYSTTVTADLVPKCMEDLVKVVIDTRTNPLAPTGKFCCVYSESLIHHLDSSDQIDLRLEGTKIQIDKNCVPNDVFTDSGIMISPGPDIITANRLFLKPIKSVEMGNKKVKGPYLTYLRRIKKTVHFKYEPNVVKNLSNREIERKVELQPIPSFQIGLLKNQIIAVHLMCSQETFKVKGGYNRLEKRPSSHKIHTIFNDLKNNQIQLIFKNENVNTPSPFPTPKKNIRDFVLSKKGSLNNMNTKLPLHLCDPKLDLNSYTNNMKKKRTPKSCRLTGVKPIEREPINVKKIPNSKGDQNILTPKNDIQLIDGQKLPITKKNPKKRVNKITNKANVNSKNVLQLKNNQNDAKGLKEVPVTKVNFDGGTLNRIIKKQNINNRNEFKLCYQKPLNEGIVN